MKANYGAWGTLNNPIPLAWFAYQCDWGDGGPRPTAVLLGCDFAYAEIAYPGICMGEIKVEPDCEQCRKAAEQSAPAQQTVANPMSLQSGAKIQNDRDYASADGLLVVERQYRSRMRGLPTMSGFGPEGFGGNWLGLIPGRLAFGGSHKDLAEYYPNSGSMAQFAISNWSDENDFNYKQDGQGRLKLSFVASAPQGRTAYFSSAISGTAAEFKLTFSNGDYTLYRRTSIGSGSVTEAVPIQQVTASGYTQYFDYNGTTKSGMEVPYQMHDSFGRVLTFTWFEPTFNGTIVTIGGPAISQIGLPDGTTLNYTYENAPIGVAMGRNDRLDNVKLLSATSTLLL